ncbi:hypothetical protein Q8A73_015124 [Channa argus]|nr:hypothetical protein Q8A73_015124 [Channa argus]
MEQVSHSAEISTNVLPWKFNKLKEKYDRDMKFWEKQLICKTSEIKSLEDKIVALQEDAEASKKRETDLQASLQLCQKEIEKLTLLLKDLTDKKEKKQRQIITQYKQKISHMDTNFKQLLAEELQKKDDEIARMQADFFDRLAQQEQKAANELLKQAQKHACELDEMKNQLSQIEVSHKWVVEKLQNELISKEKNFEEEREQQKVLREKEKMKEIMLKNEIKKQKDIIKSQASLVTTVSQLEGTLAEKNTVLDSRNKEIVFLKKEKKDIQDRWFRETDTNAMASVKINELTDTNQCLQDEKAELQSELTKKTDELNRSQRTTMELYDTIRVLKGKVKAAKPDLKELKAKVRALETYHLRFKEDLHACVSVFFEPRVFTSRFMTLKRRYLDSEDTLLMDGNDRIAFQMQVNFLQRKLSFCEKTQRKESTQLKQTQKRLVNTLDLLDRNEGHYLQLLNERTQKVHQLKKDLAKTQKQLDKTNQPAHHTGKVGKVVEEPMNLYQIKTSCADDISSSQVPQYIDEPFVDDGI